MKVETTQGLIARILRQWHQSAGRNLGIAQQDRFRAATAIRWKRLSFGAAMPDFALVDAFAGDVGGDE
jgi:hypothetical protein